MRMSVPHLITSLSDYIKSVSPCLTDPQTILFRGQREDKPLLPKLARIKLSQSLLEAEQSMMDAFKRRSVPYLRYRPETEWDWLAVAQHYGMPTRLLDWSANPLTALWFAVQYPAAKSERKENQNGVVWVLKPEAHYFANTTLDINIKKILHTQIYTPRHIASRIVSQLGWFTLHASSIVDPYFLPLEESESYKKSLTKILISGDSFAELRISLNGCGINNSSVYPGLEGLCKYIEWAYSYLDDEVKNRTVNLSGS